MPLRSRAEFAEALASLPEPCAASREAAVRRQGTLTKPPGSLGRLEDIAVALAGWHRGMPRAARIKVVVFAGNHGIVAQGVSPYPPSVTVQMVANFAAGGAAINAISNALGLELEVVPLDLDRPTADATQASAMTEAETLAALSAGVAVVADQPDVLVLGEMGIGNTTIAACLAARSFGGTGRDWAGPGTGLDAKGVSWKAQVVDRVVARHAEAPVDGFETLMRVGGRETAAIAGAILAARHASVPVIIDGYVVSASLAALYADNPAITAHCLAGHVSAETAHARLLHRLGLVAILDLGLRLGEGTGAALAASIVRAAVAAHLNMATFGEANVEGRNENS
ncbi:MAG: nicotinate-nucleotide--dimethylbenzimidazole phosphoribosyltransferase [Hyphomicrobiaceae bacterium]|nr:nicotinate-nucleotide--dimethylbenzimidazole phosphoribosyltransferase [Hyphomicrobiaceae bacterium]